MAKIIKIEPSNKELPDIIKYCIGNPSLNKIYAILEKYKTENNILLGYYRGNILVGVVGFKVGDIHIKDDTELNKNPTIEPNFSKTSITILHLSVIPTYQKCGIGFELINYLKQQFSCINAETDSESIKFYEKQGFTCVIDKNSKWEGRFWCMWKRH